jgi:hypothetical protein
MCSIKTLYLLNNTIARNNSVTEYLYSTRKKHTRIYTLMDLNTKELAGKTEPICRELYTRFQKDKVIMPSKTNDEILENMTRMYKQFMKKEDHETLWYPCDKAVLHKGIAYGRFLCEYENIVKAITGKEVTTCIVLDKNIDLPEIAEAMYFPNTNDSNSLKRQGTLLALFKSHILYDYDKVMQKRKCV